jgi:hypothetical protein
MTSATSSEKQLKKLELLEQIKLLENEGDEQPPQIEEVKDDDETIEKPPKVKRIVKQRTEKQIESLLKGRMKMAQNQEEKRKIKEQENIIHKQELEKKLIDKAIKVKKKQLKKIEIFDDLSDEDTTPRVIQKPKVQTQLKAPPVAIQPQIIDPYDVFKKKFNIR